MWIKWKYNDHGHPDFKELEIPDDLDGWETVEEWICERGLVPQYSERFSTSRIKWEKLELTTEELKTRRIAGLEACIASHESALKEARSQLAELKPAKLVSFSNLPLGTRFRYPGSDRVYTILEQRRHRKDSEPCHGVVAVWEPNMVDKVNETFDPQHPHVGRWHGQNIFRHAPVECGGDCPDMVEPID